MADTSGRSSGTGPAGNGSSRRHTAAPLLAMPETRPLARARTTPSVPLRKISQHTLQLVRGRGILPLDRQASPHGSRVGDGGFHRAGSDRKRRYPGATIHRLRPGESRRSSRRHAACRNAIRGDMPSVAASLIGNVWEWTSDDFLPFPGFVADPYKEYPSRGSGATRSFAGAAGRPAHT